MRLDYEKAQGRTPEDVSERNLGYDIRSVDTRSGELRLIEVKGLSAEEGGDPPNSQRAPSCAGSDRLLLALRDYEVQVG